MQATITIHCENSAEYATMLRVLNGGNVQSARQILVEPRVKTPDESQAIAAEVINAAQVQPFAQQTTTGVSLAERTNTEETTPPAVEAKRVRKPRSDAGQPRAPYKTTGEQAASEPAPVGDSASAAAVAPATPTTSSNPQTGGKEPTREDAHAALKRMHEIKGMGTPATIKHLQEFGTDKLSLLDPKHFPLFIAGADEKVAKFLKAAPAA